MIGPPPQEPVEEQPFVSNAQAENMPPLEGNGDQELIEPVDPSDQVDPSLAPYVPDTDQDEVIEPMTLPQENDTDFSAVEAPLPVPQESGQEPSVSEPAQSEAVEAYHPAPAPLPSFCCDPCNCCD